MTDGRLRVIGSAGAYGWVYARNWLRWRREARAPKPPVAAALDLHTNPEE